MISNEDVTKLYRSLDTPGVRGKFDNSLQVSRGVFAIGEKNAEHICQRGFAIFERFGTIQEFCFGCYKILIEPRTVMELFKLLLLFEELDLPNRNFRKCMAETREDCGGVYKGYVYCGGTEDADGTYRIIREAVSDEISPHISVNMKRGCSEFGAAYPEFPLVKPKDGVEPMKYNEDWRVHEKYFDEHAKFVTTHTITKKEDSSRYTPAEIFAMTFFLHYAATIGDESYLEIAGRPLAPLPHIKRPPFVSPGA